LAELGPLVAYFTESTKHQLRRVSHEPDFAGIVVPFGTFKQSRLPKSRRMRDRAWSGADSGHGGGGHGGPARSIRTASSMRYSPLQETVGGGTNGADIRIKTSSRPHSKSRAHSNSDSTLHSRSSQCAWDRDRDGRRPSQKSHQETATWKLPPLTTSTLYSGRSPLDAAVLHRLHYMTVA
jgi:hypothetical protein